MKLAGHTLTFVFQAFYILLRELPTYIGTQFSEFHLFLHPLAALASGIDHKEDNTYKDQAEGYEEPHQDCKYSTAKDIVFVAYLRRHIDGAPYMALPYRDISCIREADAYLRFSHRNIIEDHVGDRLLRRTLKHEGSVDHPVAAQAIDIDVADDREMIAVKSLSGVFTSVMYH